jgi:hypothetical protein
MTYWNFGIYADRAHSTVCYTATVDASSERDAVAMLRMELKMVPVPLYIGPMTGQSIKPPDPDQSNPKPDVLIVKAE